MRKAMVVAAALLWLPGCMMPQKHTEIDVGYQYLDLDDVSYQHETHPGDRGFLTGPAGETEVDDAHAAKFSVRLKTDIAGEDENALDVYGGLGTLLVFERDEKKNENDPRPTGHHSGIYSQIFPVAPLIEGGVRKWFPVGKDSGYLGVSSQYNFYFVEHGWDRFDEDEADEREVFHSFNLGPSAGIKLGENLVLRAEWFFTLSGDGNQIGSLGLIFKF